MIDTITESLYAETPGETLYHYTTFSGMMGILEQGAIWASDIRYMNDSAELRHTVDLISAEVRERIGAGHANPGLLNSFTDWVSRRMTNGHMLFAASFRANGNLLSQWRGYSAPGKGVSLGFSPEQLRACATARGFRIGRCVYDPGTQRALISQVLDAVESEARLHPQDADHAAFERLESDLLRIAAILKHPSFREEEEWRVVSPVITDFRASQIRFREGASMLVPFVSFALTPADDERPRLEHLYLGPTPNITLSMNSLELYLKRQGIEPAQGISYCQIPYRQR